MNTTTTNSTVHLLDQIAHNLYRYGIPPVFILGITGHIINLFLFTRPTLINTSCSIYFLASSLTSLFQILFNQPVNFLKYGIQINWTSIWWCRIRFYIAHSTYMASCMLFTLASVDRFASSCRQAKLRKWASVSIARKFALIAIVVAFVFNSHILGMFTVNYRHENECWAEYGSTYRFIFDLILVTFIIIYPLLIGTFGLLTIYNIRRCYARRPLSSSLSDCVRDSQRMTLVQTACIIILTVPYAIIKLHRTIATSMYDDKSDIYWAVERFISCFVDFGCYINDGAGFYIYSLSAVTFRRTLLQLFD